MILKDEKKSYRLLHTITLRYLKCRKLIYPVFLNASESPTSPNLLSNTTFAVQSFPSCAHIRAKVHESYTRYPVCIKNGKFQRKHVFSYNSSLAFIRQVSCGVFWEHCDSPRTCSVCIKLIMSFVSVRETYLN